jgi:predicted enzyme related to lactoylglutathione lyase
MQLLVNIDVDDIEKGISFYQRGIGLQLARRLFDGTVAEMTGGQTAIYLIANPADSIATPSTSIRRQYSRHWTPVHLDFATEDIHGAVERAVAAGASQEGEIQSFAWGQLATMSDPFGHGFCFVQPVGTPYEDEE